MFCENASPKKSVVSALFVYLIVSLFLIFEMAVQVTPSVMAPQLMSDLALDPMKLGLMSGFYFYTYAAMQIPSGLLFDRFKPKPIVTLSILICALGSFLFAFAPSFAMGCVARLLTGLGSAFAFVSVLVVASDLFSPKSFAVITGITQMLAALGAMMGQMPVSIMVNHLGWRHSLEALGGVGLLLALLVWKLMNYERCSQQLNEGHFSDTPTIFKSLKQILKSGQTWWIGLYALLLWAPMSGFASLWGVEFLSKADGLSPTNAAFYCSLMWIGLAVFSPLLGLFSTVINNKWFALVLAALIGTVSFGFIFFTQLSGFWLGFCLILAGGACAGQSLSFALIRDNNSTNVRATALAFNNMAVVLSGAVFQPLIGHLISQGKINTTSQLYSLENYKSGIFCVFLAYMLGTLIAALLIKRKND